MYSQALALYRSACNSQDPHGYISRWLIQEFTPDCCAVAILALYQLTGEIYVHPETPKPDLIQKATCPEIWRDAVQRVVRHDPNLDRVKVGDVLHAPTVDKITKFLLQMDPIVLERDDLPEGLRISAPAAFSRINGIVKTKEEREREKLDKMPPIIRFVKSKKRGEGAQKRFSVN